MCSEYRSVRRLQAGVARRNSRKSPVRGAFTHRRLSVAFVNHSRFRSQPVLLRHSEPIQLNDGPGVSSHGRLHRLVITVSERYGPIDANPTTQSSTTDTSVCCDSTCPSMIACHRTSLSSIDIAARSPSSTMPEYPTCQPAPAPPRGRAHPTSLLVEWLSFRHPRKVGRHATIEFDGINHSRPDFATTSPIRRHRLASAMLRRRQQPYAARRKVAAASRITPIPA